MLGLEHVESLVIVIVIGEDFLTVSDSSELRLRSELDLLTLSEFDFEGQSLLACP